MGIFGREQKTQRYLAGGKAVSCPTCGGTELAKSEAQLHTAGLTFFQLECLGKSAHVLVALIWLVPDRRIERALASGAR